MKKVFIFAAVFIFVISSVFVLGSIKRSPEVHLTAAISQQLLNYFKEQIALLLKKIQELQQQLNELIAKQKEEEAATTILVAAAPAATATAPALPSPFDSTLKIEGTYQSRTISTYGEKILNEIKLSADEKIGITRIKFKNSGTFHDVYLVNIRLINSRTDSVVATVDTPVDKVIEFEMAADSAKPDNGLAVSGETYYIYAYILTPSFGSVKPKIQLDIESASDIDAFDYNDLTRVANITKNNTFPIIGPTITVW